MKKKRIVLFYLSKIMKDKNVLVTGGKFYYCENFIW